VQLALQAMLLEEQGYRVEKVAAYYQAEHRRVVVDLTAELRDQARAEVAAARATHAQLKAPPPLVDSPKCRGCSLNAICQPDEVCAVTGLSSWEAGTELRRVVPSSADAVPAYVSLAGARVGVRGSSLTVTPPEGSDVEKATIGLGKTAHLAIVGNAQISTQALRACLEAGIPVCFLSTGARLFGIAVGDESRAVHVRIAQHAAHAAPENGLALAIARVLIADKIANQRTVLRRNAADAEIDDGVLPRMQRLVDEVGARGCAASLLAVEAEAGKRYWSVFSTLAANWLLRPDTR
jgi:hypothetical protein